MAVADAAQDVWGEPGDPRNVQKRLAVSPSGRTVWVEVTGDDRLRIVKQLPSRWPEVIMARERGETLERIASWAKVPPPCKPACRIHSPSAISERTGLAVVAENAGEHVGPACLSYLIAECYNFVENRLNDLVETRARLMP